LNAEESHWEGLQQALINIPEEKKLGSWEELGWIL
jgi:hypothetical protein